MSNAYMEGLTKTRKPNRRYSAAGKGQRVNLSIHNYQYKAIPADWPVATGDCVQWVDAHGEILQGTVRGARNINGVAHVTVKMDGGKVKPVALDSLMVSSPAIAVDPEFKALIPALTTEEYTALEESLLNEGCRDALVVWAGHNLLVDGHNRYELCTQHNLPYKTVEREFDSRESAMLWMIANQGSRRNLTSYQRGMLADKRQIILDRITPKQQGSRTDLFPNSEKSSQPVNTWQQASQDFGVAKDTISKVRTVESKAPESVKQAARSGEISTNKAYELTKALEKLPEEYRDHAAENTDSPERVGIWLRLYKSMGSPETNGTFEEIHRTGGFQYGKDMDKWCAFWTDPIEVIHKALQSVADHHKREEAIIKAQARAEKAQSLPTGVYNVIYADPPWQYDNSGVSGAAAAHYDTMPLADICALPRNINLQVSDNAVLFMWVTNPFLQDAFEVVKAWGFEYKTNMVWVKTDLVKSGMGFYVRGRHEMLFICTRGSFTPLDKHISPPIDSVLEASLQEHSRKPDDVYSIIERLYPDCNYLEMFARRPREGWDVYGNEV